MRKWKVAVPILAAAAVIAAGAGTMGVQAAKADTKTVAKGIYIGEVNVGGMTELEVEDAVADYVDSLQDEKVTLSANGHSLEATVAELGLKQDVDASVQTAVKYGKTGNLIDRYKAAKDLEQKDIVLPLTMSVDEAAVQAYLEAHVEEVNQDPVDYGLTRENGSFVITGGEEGVEVNVAESVVAVKDYFTAGWTGDAVTVDLVVQVAEPQGSEEELSKVKDVLGTFTTNYSSSAWGRKANVKNGARLINGSLIYPGETFSVYEAVSPFDAEHGYELAGSYENGTTVQTYGGGICQVSTTLYNAVIRAELEVVERSGHSMLVSYVEPSSDAAISGTYKDFKFKNNLDVPVYIEGYADGASLSFTIYGEETRPSNRKVTFESVTTSTTQPTTKYEASGAAIGSMSKTQSSHVGKTAELYKVVTVDGVQQSREKFNSTSYRMSPTIYSVGTGSSSSEATAAMKAAIATQNEGTIKAAMAQWNSSALKKKQEEEEAAKKEAEEKEKAEKEAAEKAAAEKAAAEAAAEAAAAAAAQTPDPAPAEESTAE